VTNKARFCFLAPLFAAASGFGLAQITNLTFSASTSDEAHALLKSGIDLYNQSRFPDALERLERAETLARQRNDIELLLQIKEVEGNSLRTLGRLDESLRDYDEWFRLNRQLPHPKPEGRATRFLAILYREIGDTDKFEALARRALTLARAERDPELEAGCLLSVGALYKDRGRFGEAVLWHKRALTLAKRENLSRLQAEILNSLADAEHHLGRLDDAESHFQLALHLAETLGYSGLEEQVTARIGELDIARGRYDDAIALFARATELNHQLGDPVTKVFDVDLDWARAERAAGRPEQALAHYRDAIGEVERLEELTVPTEFARALPVAVSRQAYEEATDLLSRLNRQSDAFELADSGRAHAFIDLLSESNAHLRRPEPASVQAVQRELLDHQTAFIEYMLAASHSYAWTVTREGMQAVTLPPRSQIEPLLKTYRALLSQPVTKLTVNRLSRQVREQGRELYRMLVAPLADSIAGKKRLLIVPDGVLANVPFESLTDDAGHYLLEKYAVVYSQSASGSLMLQALALEAPAPAQDLLAFGDPVYDVSSLPPIPYTREEVTGIARLFPESGREVFLGQAASESKVKSGDLTRFGYLHFAAHASVDDANPARSGLVLSHESGSAEDGILRAEEIARLRLNANLVVLSGCRTADGRLLEGEGLLAISRSFQYAGARAVVATLWNVDDISTAAFMKIFYGQIRGGQTPEVALRQAKLRIANGDPRLWRNPWFWSPFVLFR